MFIKKIFENKIDESVHKHFIRFGKGIYDKRAIINVTKNSEKIRMSTSFEFANDLVVFVSGLAQKFSVKGVILSKEKIDGFDFRKKTGIFCATIEKEMSSYELKQLAEKAYATLLDCNAPGISLKIKKKLPKPSKTGETKVDEKFCVLELDKRFWQKLHDEFLFDLPNEMKKGKIEHSYFIKEIVLPPSSEKETDFEKLRILAKKKGILQRKIIADGKEIIKEKEFVA